jgi:hypothetical protein
MEGTRQHHQFIAVKGKETQLLMVFAYLAISVVLLRFLFCLFTSQNATYQNMTTAVLASRLSLTDPVLPDIHTYSGSSTRGEKRCHFDGC